MVTCSVKLKNMNSLPPGLQRGPSHPSSSQLRLLHSSITMQSGLPNPQPLTCLHKLFTVPGTPSPPPSLLGQGLFLLLQSSSGHFRAPRQRVPRPRTYPPTHPTILVNHIVDCCSCVWIYLLQLSVNSSGLLFLSKQPLQPSHPGSETSVECYQGQVDPYTQK